MPYEKELEIWIIIKQLSALVELNGFFYSIPNYEILLNTLAIQEAKDSSAVENIITTHDELFKSDLEFESMSPAIKEVQNYVAAMKRGFELVENKGLLTNQIILQLCG